MNSIPFPEILLTVLTIVDDWYQENASDYRKGQPGRKPKFSDSEVMTLVIAMDYLPYPSERQYLCFIRANYSDLFPDLLDQSQFNRRARDLAGLLERFRRYLIVKSNLHLGKQSLLDTKPIPVVGYKRSKKRSDFLGSANYGYCSSKKMYYFGYKLVAITTIEGIPLVYDLVSANTDERLAAESIIDYIKNNDIFADKGFIGEEWQKQIKEQTGNDIWTPKRENQLVQNPTSFDEILNKVRLRIEGAFNELQNTGKNIERLLAKKISGLALRVTAKMTSHLMKYIFREFYKIDVQSFSYLEA